MRLDMDFPEMLRLLSRSVVALLIVAASACHDATTTPDSNIRFSLESESDTPLSSATNSTANAAGGPGVVVVSGRIVLPSPCFALSPRVVQTSGALDLTILARPS